MRPVSRQPPAAKKHSNERAKTKTSENKLRESSIAGKLSGSSTCTRCYSLAMCLSLMPFAQKRRESAQRIQPSHGLDASYRTSNGKSKDLVPFATIFRMVYLLPTQKLPSTSPYVQMKPISRWMPSPCNTTFQTSKRVTWTFCNHTVMISNSLSSSSAQLFGTSSVFNYALHLILLGSSRVKPFKRSLPRKISRMGVVTPF